MPAVVESALSTDVEVEVEVADGERKPKRSLLDVLAVGVAPLGPNMSNQTTQPPVDADDQ